MVRQVKLERVGRGAKIYEVAGALGLDPQQWRRIESGERDVPPDVAERAAVLFGRPVEELFKVVDAEPLVMAEVGR